MSTEEDSILTSTKKLLGIMADFTVFDMDIAMHINSVFFTLQQLGVGPDRGFMITGPEQVWASFMEGRDDILAVKTYMYLKVRLIFDPPATSFAIEAMNKLATEFEWRLNLYTDTEGAPR